MAVPHSAGPPVLGRVFCGILTPLFILAALVQYNDPDPLRWILVYAAAAGVCGSTAFGRTVRAWIPAAMAAGTGIVGAIYGVPVLGRVMIGQLFAGAGMKTAAVEEARESLGLLIVMLSMLMVLLLRPKVRQGADSRDRSARRVA